MCMKASELTGSIPSAGLPLTDISHALFDHVAQLLQQRRDAIAVSLMTSCYHAPNQTQSHGGGAGEQLLPNLSFAVPFPPKI